MAGLDPAIQTFNVRAWRQTGWPPRGGHGEFPEPVPHDRPIF